MGFWGKLFGRAEYDTTVTEYQQSVTDHQRADTVHQPAVAGHSVRFTVEDVFFITGRGTVVTGRIVSGVLSVGDPVTVRKADGSSIPATVTGIEAFRKVQSSAGPGEMVGVLLDGVARHDLARGDTLEA